MEPTFWKRPRCVTVARRNAVKTHDGKWRVTYSHHRTAQIADDQRLVYFLGNSGVYLVYNNVHQFIDADPLRPTASRANPCI